MTKSDYMSLKEEQKEKVKRTNKHTTSKKKSKQKNTPKRKLSPTVKPQGMTLSDWQVSLRRMAAKDEQTGETTLRIPVADKQTVRNILGMISKLFGQ